MEELRAKFINAIAEAGDEAALEDVRIAAVGKKGEVALKMRELGKMSPEERQVAGPALNALKDEINSALAARKASLADAALEERLRSEWLDVTLPARRRGQGTIHPVSQVTEEVTAIFADMGFAVAEGPRIDSDWYNFDALNIPGHHPARAEMDTFYMHRGEGDTRPPHVLRTHTSPVQIRTMEKTGAPVRVICPGGVYRADYDQTHTPMFHQVEGLAVDKDISMANLKWTLEEFVKAFFNVDNVELRFRASHFPFTEPSAEVDLRCSWADGQLRVGEGDDWMEILGSGMVHPKVLAAGGIDPEQWQGFAFGMGIDRIAMLKYGIPDLRSFFDSDLRWLRHYGFAALDQPTLHGGTGAVSGAKILIVESNPPDLIAAQGYRACDQFKAAFAELEPSVKCQVAEPYATKFHLEKLDDIDGVVFTGSGVNWSVDAKEAAPLREVMEHVFQSDLPVWGSCNGMQLAAVVLGGSVRPSPNGLEVGVARDTRKTEAGKSHPALDGRTDVYAVPCIHRDEVERLPKGAVLLAENDHSPVQSFSYRAEGVDFWGAQYHPECSATSIAKSLRTGNSVFSAQTALIDDLEAGERDARAAERLGTTCAALHPKERTRELANWLMHVKDRISS